MATGRRGRASDSCEPLCLRGRWAGRSVSIEERAQGGEVGFVGVTLQLGDCPLDEVRDEAPHGLVVGGPNHAGHRAMAHHLESGGGEHLWVDVGVGRSGQVGPAGVGPLAPRLVEAIAEAGAPDVVGPPHRRRPRPLEDAQHAVVGEESGPVGASPTRHPRGAARLGTYRGPAMTAWHHANNARRPPLSPDGNPQARIDESRHRESSQLTGSPGSPRAHETRQRRTP